MRDRLSAGRTAPLGLRARYTLALVATFSLVLATATTATATRSDLVAFLERAERMTAHNRAVRADIKIARSDGSTESAVLIVDPERGRQFFALRSSNWRSLSPLDWSNGKAVAGSGAKPHAHGADEPLAATDLRALEFFPFWKSNYATAFISDDNRMEKTVTLYADDAIPYILFVITFDKTKMIPTLTKYYKDAMSNLVRLRKDSDHIMVGSRPRPRSIVITDYTDNRETIYSLDWHTLESVPEGLLSEADFATAPIRWAEDSIAAR